MRDEGRQLWRVGEFDCVMMSCCSGAELQVRRIAGEPESGRIDDREIVLRELYPLKSDLYERARDLKREYERTTASAPGR